MRLAVLAIRDRAANAFDRPMFFTSLGAAIRAFGDEINRKHDNNSMNKHPEDYDLYHLGEYNDEDAQFAQLPKPKQIAIGKDFHRPEL